jgi:cytochrome c
VPPLRVARPRDPWVFRCVLDRKPRMVTVALSDEMWVAYDATNCGLTKAWKGGVNFDGPVYTTVHGPQPTSVGPSYTEGFEGDVWEANVAGQDVKVRAVWRGYVLNGDHVALQYSIQLPDGRAISVQESPEFVRAEDLFDTERREELVLPEGRPGLWRSFLARDVPADTKLTLKVRTDAEGKLAETLERERFVDVVDAKGETHTQVVSHLVLTKQRPTSNLVLFFAPLELPAPDAGAQPPANPKAGKQ